MIQLGIMKKIEDLRQVWAHEALEFTPWLAKPENMKLLGETIGMDIEVEETESDVDGFSADIVGIDTNTGKKVIIENQLEDTDHDHLGKIITYASGKGAEVIVWIVKRARDEHRQAVEWLNQHTDENIGFFLVEIELWRINDSLPAPKFTIIEKPNDWAKTMKVVEGLSEHQKMQLEFWRAFIDYAFNNDEFKKTFTQRKAQPQHWYDVSVGSSVYHIAFTINSQKKKLGAEIYIHNDKETYEHFKKFATEIEQEIGSGIVWREANKDCRILVLHDGDVKKGSDSWTQYFEWFCKMGIQLKKITTKYGN